LAAKIPAGGLWDNSKDWGWWVAEEWWELPFVGVRNVLDSALYTYENLFAAPVNKGVDIVLYQAEKLDNPTFDAVDIELTFMAQHMASQGANVHPLAALPAVVPAAGATGMKVLKGLGRFSRWTRRADKATDSVRVLDRVEDWFRGLGHFFRRGSRVKNAQFFDDLALKATRNPNSKYLVLGKFDEAGRSYTKVGAHYKATYFKVENWRELSGTLTEGELWRINEAFLDQQLKLGKQIIFSHDPAKATGGFLNEVVYLERLGYEFVQDGWVWRAVKK
jgi:hypothetical protein